MIEKKKASDTTSEKKNQMTIQVKQTATKYTSERKSNDCTREKHNKNEYTSGQIIKWLLMWNT